MKKKANITVVIPIHSHKSANFDIYLQNAIQSILNGRVLPMHVLIIMPTGDTNNGETLLYVSKLISEKISKLEGYKDLDVTIRGNLTGKYDFASQMNAAVDWISKDSHFKTEFFSFLEFDDEYSSVWFSNVEKYMAEFPEVSVFLPIISDANEEKKFLGYTNEIAWAYEFTDKHGIIDSATLQDYPNFNPDGMVMRVADYLKIGGYKKTIKLSFNLEFLMRACGQALQVMVIPKIGYQHTNMREGSIFWDYKNGDNKLTPEESEFWMEKAKSEYYYTDDRPIIYVPEAIEDEPETK
jgi:hypothetical protein